LKHKDTEMRHEELWWAIEKFKEFQEAK